MKKSGLSLIVLSALMFAGAASATADEVCRQEVHRGLVTIPATPAVTEERLVPAVTEERVVPAVHATEYEYIQRASQEGQPGQGAGTRWEAEGWNADSNPQSNGWIRTGETRQVLVTPETTETVVVVPETTETVIVVPEIPAIMREEVLGGVTICEPAPTTPEAPAPLSLPVDAAPAPVAAPPAAAPAAAGPAPLPAELAYTGAAEDILAWTAVSGLGLLVAGVAIAVVARPRRGSHRQSR